MSKEWFLRRAKTMIERGERYAAGTFRFGPSDIYRFSYDLTEEFNEEPEILNDPECLALMNDVLKAMTKLFKDIINDKDWSALAEAVCDARSDFNYNKKYYWLWYPEKLMNEIELKEWEDYLKKHGYSEEMNKETIWDYKPTEEEIKIICEEFNLKEKTIVTENRNKDDCRLACLCKLFSLRKQYKERDRIIEEFTAKAKNRFDIGLIVDSLEKSENQAKPPKKRK